MCRRYAAANLIEIVSLYLRPFSAIAVAMDSLVNAKSVEGAKVFLCRRATEVVAQ